MLRQLPLPWQQVAGKNNRFSADSEYTASSLKEKMACKKNKFSLLILSKARR